MDEFSEFIQDLLQEVLVNFFVGVLIRKKWGIPIGIILFLILVVWRIGSQVKPASSTTNYSQNSTRCLNMSKVPTLRMGSKGKAVEVMQGRLQELGYSTSIDGEFGLATRQAVVNFQSSRGLRSDGVVGNNTWLRLFKQCS